MELVLYGIIVVLLLGAVASFVLNTKQKARVVRLEADWRAQIQQNFLEDVDEREQAAKGASESARNGLLLAEARGLGEFV